jgi:4-hydroxybenzoate polyprenyltransferase
VTTPTSESVTVAAETATIANGSLGGRYGAYLAERFPPIAHAVLILSFYSSTQFLAHALEPPAGPMRYDLGSLAGFVTLYCFFLHLRVFDDLKDYEADCRHFPDRVLQRGIVTRAHLRWMGAAAIGIEIALAAVIGTPALVAVLIAIAYSILMLYEFFVADWLQRRFLLYASVHMAITSLLSLVVYGFATGRLPWEAPVWFWLYSLVGFFVGFNWEVSRKIRAPEQEIDGVDSYTKLFGTYGAGWIVMLVRVIDTGLVMLVGRHLGLSGWFYASLVLLFVVCALGFLRYRLHTTPATAKAMEIYAGLYIVAFDLLLAVELVRTHGIVFGWRPA